jgi:Secretion system C-terminal sorting domain
MKKLTLSLLMAISITSFGQQKSSGDITLLTNVGGASSVNVVANITLDNTISKVTVVLKGPSDRWFGMGIGVLPGFGMASMNDVIIFSDVTTPKLTDRNFIGFTSPATDTNQDWTMVSNTVAGSIRTLTLTRNLTNSDTAGSDFQMPYATTNSISIACVRPASATQSVGSHGGTTNVGYATVPLSTLGVEDFSLNASSVFPNPTKADFTVTTKTALSEINVYSHTGAFVKKIKVNNNTAANVKVDGLQTGVYLLELKNGNDKSWKKIIVE